MLNVIVPGFLFNPNIPDLSIKHTHTQYTNCPLCLNASVNTSQTQVSTQRNAALLCPHSSLRDQDRHSGVNDALASLSLTDILTASFTIHQTPLLNPLFDVETPSTFPVNPRDFWARSTRCMAEQTGLLHGLCAVSFLEKKTFLDLESRS